MADSSLNELDYGRPGLTIYDLDSHEWTFSRQSTAIQLRQVAEWQVALPAATSFVDSGHSAAPTNTRKDARRLTHNYPQLAPAAKQLPELSVVSEAVTFAATTYDPLVSDLLSFGTVFLDKSGRSKRIAALPAGPSGNILHLVVLGQQKQGWGEDKSVWLSGLSFKDADSGYWNEDAASIQQVCFAQVENSNSFLAVRLASRTVLFRPLYRRGRQAAEPSTHYDLPPSIVSAHPKYSFTLDQTGGVPHADVTFNPDYQFQFGIIDQLSNWSVWQIERRVKRDEYSASRLVGGGILPPGDTSLDEGDGWARILWAGDNNTLLVCNRRHLSLISIKEETFEHLPVPSIIPQRSTDWILDIRRHPQRQNHFLILSSTKLFVMAVVTSSATVDSTAGQAGARVLFSRKHYRGDEDITLQLSVQTLSVNETCVFLISRLNKLIQVYYLQDDSSDASDIIISSDPTALDLNLPVVAHVTHMHLEVLEYGTRAQSKFNQRNDSAHLYLEKAIPFYQLTVALSDLSVLQTVLLPEGSDVNPEPLVWSKTVSANRSLYTSTNVDEMDDFLVPNGLIETTTPELKLKSQTPRLLPPSDQPNYRVMDYTAIYDALSDTDQKYTAVGNSTSMEAITERLREMMGADVNPLEPHPGYIIDNLNDAIGVADIDEVSTKFDELFATKDLQYFHVLQRIAPQHVLHLPGDGELSVSALYDTLLQDWIAPLPVGVPIRVRQTKERLARRIAAEVTLATTRLRHKENEPLSQPSLGQGNSTILPILPSKPGNGVNVGSATNMVPSTLSTPPQSSVPPPAQPPSSASLPEHLQSLTRDPLFRLRKHLSIDDKSITPTVISPSVNELLSHWEPGVDPSKYDWEATEQVLRPKVPDEVSQELREKERKKRERREKRQRRENEIMRAKTQTSSQPVYVQPALPRSSPGPTFGGMATSSQVQIPGSDQMPSQSQSQGTGFGVFAGVHSMVPQSQVEPGRFGGRLDKKKKKGKSRVSGF